LLDQLIQRTRLQMFADAKFYGFTDDKTVQTSQALDHLLNCFQQKYSVQNAGPDDHYKVHGSIIQNINSGLQSNRIRMNCGLLEKDPSNWYSLKDVYQFFQELEEEYDEGLIRDIGKFVPINSIFPSDVDSFEKGLLNLNVAYKLNHSHNMDGYYEVFFESKREIYLICNTRFYPTAYNEGILKGMSEKFHTPIQITLVKKDKGGEFKIELLSA
jgi:hypothetical protein